MIWLLVACGAEPESAEVPAAELVQAGQVVQVTAHAITAGDARVAVPLSGADARLKAPKGVVDALRGTTDPLTVSVDAGVAYGLVDRVVEATQVAGVRERALELPGMTAPWSLAALPMDGAVHDGVFVQVGAVSLGPVQLSAPRLTALERPVLGTAPTPGGLVKPTLGQDLAAPTWTPADMPLTGAPCALPCGLADQRVVVVVAPDVPAEQVGRVLQELADVGVEGWIAGPDVLGL